MKILVVDDEPLARERLLRLLGKTQPDAALIEAGKHPLPAHVQADGQKPRWWLETASFPIRVLNGKRVETRIIVPGAAG